MTLRVIGSGEIVQHVFWLDLRTRTCGVRLLHPQTGRERCGELPLASFFAVNGAGNRPGASAELVEIVLGERAQEILRDE